MTSRSTAGSRRPSRTSPRDTIKDDQGESFYRVYLRTDRNTLIHADNELPIIPGMTATVEILTGEKSVLDYLLKPLLKARDRALRER